MAEQPDNLVVVMLRCVDTKMDRVIDDFHDLKVHMTSVEEGLNGIQRRIDRMEDRLDHVEKRLDLTGPAPGFAE